MKTQHPVTTQSRPVLVIFNVIVFLAAFVCIVSGVIMRRDGDPTNASTAKILIVCGSAYFALVGLCICCLCSFFYCAVAAGAVYTDVEKNIV